MGELAWGGLVVAAVAVALALMERSLGAGFERKRNEERMRLLAHLAGPGAVEGEVEVEVEVDRPSVVVAGRGSSRTSAGSRSSIPRHSSATGGTTSPRSSWSTTPTD